MDWLIEFIRAIGRGLAQPTLYWFILLLIVSAYLRRKNDRKQFGVKVKQPLIEAGHTVFLSLVAGLILSILCVLLGITFSYPLAILLSSIFILLSLANQFGLLSPSYTLGVFFLIMILHPTIIEWFEWEGLDVFQSISLISISLLIGVFLFVESWLLLHKKGSNDFPEQIRSKRGKHVGQQRVKRLAIVPFFTLVPAGAIESFAEWWPIWQVNGDSYGLMIVPFLIGTEHVFRSMLPKEGRTWIGKRIIGLAVLILACSAGAFVYQPLIYVAVAIAFIGRIMISLRFRYLDRKNVRYFQPGGEGLLVLDVLPNTPAEDFELEPGERIMKVNGQPIHDESSFYQALQQNRTYGKLQIKNISGEIRFAERSLYEGEHHELGVLFLKNESISVDEQKVETSSI
ncbi:hypothetical protein J416_00559 [Gracilibacillus halophilus YIM-C55.5]|uniref:PDZ domain-containing protein n=1 Tax=Gracilibacillus halophilus YIM-C55.5 TaxID=1308866 RepID=N4WDT4_9BACI|nr:PDZ domain-containing protein [Gracilibacillus halophilus]ENH98428.1 hypothetical protein J416_00559 [Gracilibacillus halophilus YIM-C55.5]